MTTRDSRRDWASYEPAKIPTKTEVPELEAFMADLERGSRVLDLGCGTGRISRMLAERGFEVVGVDINEAALGDATPDAGNPRFCVRDITAPEGLGLAGPPFASVVCQLVISVVGGEAERKALLANAVASLVPGGMLYLSASEVSDDVNPGYRALYQRDFPETGERYTYYSRDGDGNILYTTHHFTGPELFGAHQRGGFRARAVVVTNGVQQPSPR